MTITLLAPDGVAVTAQQERQARAAMFGGSPARPLGGRSGFRPGTSASTLTATSTTWTLKPCALQIDPGATTAQGMYGWASDANITGSVTAADATNPRVDIVYLQISDSTSGDGSGAVSYTPQYLAGPADGSNAAPALPPRSFLLGTISVPKAGGGSPTATLNPVYCVAAGGTLPVSSQSERDALTPYAGLAVARLDFAGNVVETYDGSRWLSTAPVSYTPTLVGSSTNPSIGSGSATGTYSIVGKNMIGQFAFTFGTGSSAGSGSFQIGLPTGFTYSIGTSYVPIGAFASTGSGAPAAYITGILRQGGPSQSYMNGYWQSAPTTASVLGSGTYTWASGMNIAGSFTVSLA